MGTIYKIKVTYSNLTTEKFTIDEDRVITQIPPIRPLSIPSRRSQLTIFHEVTTWLGLNGGVKLEVKEETT